MKNNLKDITKENVSEKILVRNEGGLCYELNSLLNAFLRENGFNAILVFGVVFNRGSNEWSPTGRTHVLNILTYKGKKFVVDTGFGGNCPLKPVPLDSTIVTSRNGEFRVRKEKSEFGDYILEMKLKNRDLEWGIGYAFDPVDPVKGVCDLNLVQQVIAESPSSPFNKRTILTKFTEQGNVTLTDTSLTQWIDGREVKTQIDQTNFKKMAKQYFGIEVN